jgi:hypothetical protein
MSIEGNSTGTQVYNCILMENGLSTGGFDLWLEGASMAGFASNYNILWNAGAQPPVKINATVYRFVEDYAEDVGQDLESLQEDPRFASPAEGDFHLLPGSPAIDNASSAVPAWPSADASGTPRLDDPMAPNVGAGPIAFADRGAFEYPQHQTPPDAEPSTVDLSPAYPNPVAGPVSFRLELTEPAIIHWGIFDVQGREVWEEVRLSGAGTTDLWWDGNVRKGFPAGRGVYFARVRTDAQTFVRRFVRL